MADGDAEAFSIDTETHPCFSEACRTDRTSSACTEDVFGLCCDPDLDDCLREERSSCTPNGCSMFMSSEPPTDWNAPFVCPFADVDATCSSKQCANREHDIKDSYVFQWCTGEHCLNSKVNQLLEGQCAAEDGSLGRRLSMEQTKRVSKIQIDPRRPVSDKKPPRNNVFKVSAAAKRATVKARKTMSKTRRAAVKRASILKTRRVQQNTGSSDSPPEEYTGSHGGDPCNGCAVLCTTEPENCADVNLLLQIGGCAASCLDTQDGLTQCIEPFYNMLGCTAEDFVLQVNEEPTDLCDTCLAFSECFDADGNLETSCSTPHVCEYCAPCFGGTTETCPADFECSDGNTIPLNYVNDAYCDCSDCEDEDNPPPMFDCSDGNTIPLDYVNDNYCDCSDCEDEVNPPSQEYNSHGKGTHTCILHHRFLTDCMLEWRTYIPGMPLPVISPQTTCIPFFCFFPLTLLPTHISFPRRRRRSL